MGFLHSIAPLLASSAKERVKQVPVRLLLAALVGWAMNACHGQEDIPAHRVVNRLGLLTGKHHFEGTNLMQQLLESEGIKIQNNQIVDLEKYYWEPK